MGSVTESTLGRELSKAAWPMLDYLKLVNREMLKAEMNLTSHFPTHSREGCRSVSAHPRNHSGELSAEGQKLCPVFQKAEQNVTATEGSGAAPFFA